MDGRTFIRELQYRGHAIPVVLMAASTELPRWAAELGVAGWVGKPFELTELLTCLADCLHSTTGAHHP
jgi:CheY-like chemotaxis protein